MGRGRQKAKHTKVARELKYFSPDTNYNALERELGHGDSVGGGAVVSSAAGDARLDDDLAAWPEYAAGDPYADVDSEDETDDDEEVAQNRSA